MIPPADSRPPPEGNWAHKAPAPRLSLKGARKESV
ncbi:Uncharacterised protein [Vibrio cholerae]|nr:Uncharacterised protein [Vibrio cholerae]